MKTYVNEITGLADAIISMFMSKRTWSRDNELHVRRVCQKVLDCRGALRADEELITVKDERRQFEDWLNILVKWGQKHTAMLRFIDLSITVEGLHRAGQDDWDAHAKRFNNRIIRSSTRLANFGYEKSEWYQNRIIPTDEALAHLKIDLPGTVTINNVNYLKTVNGYIREDLINNSDTKRGLYMLSIPSNFIFKVDLTEWSHVFKERNAKGTANPEVKLCCESIADQIEEFHKQFNRDLFLAIKN